MGTRRGSRPRPRGDFAIPPKFCKQRCQVGLGPWQRSLGKRNARVHASLAPHRDYPVAGIARCSTQSGEACTTNRSDAFIICWMIIRCYITSYYKYLSMKLLYHLRKRFRTNERSILMPETHAVKSLLSCLQYFINSTISSLIAQKYLERYLGFRLDRKERDFHFLSGAAA